jgi:hypothetical protein
MTEMTTLYKPAGEGLDWRGAIELLECTIPEFKRWRQEGKIPKPDGEVLTHTFTSMSRAYDHMDAGWFPQTLERIKPEIPAWRAEHQEALKKKKTQKAA